MKDDDDSVADTLGSCDVRVYKQDRCYCQCCHCCIYVTQAGRRVQMTISHGSQHGCRFSSCPRPMPISSSSHMVVESTFESSPHFSCCMAVHSRVAPAAAAAVVGINSSNHQPIQTALLTPSSFLRTYISLLFW